MAFGLPGKLIDAALFGEVDKNPELPVMETKTDINGFEKKNSV